MRSKTNGGLVADRLTPDASRLTATLRITEIFFSLQGETSRVGLPTVFVRLTGCPLRCGYCDTTYAFQGGETLTLEKILAEVGRYRTRYVTVTGGEPLAQKHGLATGRSYRLCIVIRFLIAHHHSKRKLRIQHVYCFC